MKQYLPHQALLEFISKYTQVLSFITVHLQAHMIGIQ